MAMGKEELINWMRADLSERMGEIDDLLEHSDGIRIVIVLEDACGRMHQVAARVEYRGIPDTLLHTDDGVLSLREYAVVRFGV
ncbi:hypothetical protein JN531_016790 (plasmid) [Flagellatimonas centrodinii]|uniref:hypothetical protein n=1 Tax=Flagellatimonas centrodinii TaxID=2806210 RepID=UPI001FEDA8DA|nr:hypothetical protein [Flagellatimonas centrodinii]ULQ48435.1 hypothetical protein JN531_016790 [Flagellatimonas centrodinii]